MFETRNFAFILLFFLFFTPILSATPTSSTIQPKGLAAAEWQNWVPMTLLAILIGYFITGIGFMIASFLRSPELEAWAKNEFVEVSTSAWFVGCLIFLIGVLGLLFPENYIKRAEDHIFGLAGQITQVYVEIGKGVFVLGLFTYFQGTVPVSGIIPIVIGTIAPIKIGVNPFYGLGIVTNALLTTGSIISFAIFSLLAQYALLDFFASTMFSIFLPIGVLLRTFTLTRKLGATIMAVTVGCYVVYPLTLIMNEEIFKSIPHMNKPKYYGAFPIDTLDMGGWADVLGGPNFKKFCRKWYDWIWCWIYAIIRWIWDTIMAIINMIVFLMYILIIVARVGVAEFAASGFDYYATLIPWVMEYVVAALIFPVLDFIIVVTAIRALSPAIGGATSITGLAELV